MAEALISETACIVVKWSGKEYAIDSVGANGTVLCLKKAIEHVTMVKVERQKLLNLKHRGKPAEDSVKLSLLGLKPGFKIIMMGSLEQDIAKATAVPETSDDILNDFELVEKEIPIHQRQEYLEKIAKRLNMYNIKIMNEPRPGKKLLVLDIDYTLFDHRSVAETGNELMRPFLHEFLASAYKDYDIMIWSATSMRWIEEKMKLLGVAANPQYKIVCYLDSLAMIDVFLPERGLKSVKPLAFVWGKFPDLYSSKNTIMFDDIRRNFLLNRQNGLVIRPFREAHLNRTKDQELVRLASYLKHIAQLDDLSHLDHDNWKKYLSQQK